MSHPVSFRRHILRVKEREGLSFDETADRFSVGIASVKRWSKRLEPKPYVTPILDKGLLRGIHEPTFL